MAAASCGFYAMLALFPAISVAISLYGLIADPVAIESQLEGLRGVVPASTYQLICVRVHDLAAAGPTKLSWGLALSLLVALWSAMNGTKAIISAMNVAYEERERRSLLRLNLVAFMFTLGSILGVILALTVIVVVPAALSFAWLGPLASIAVRFCSFGLLFGFVVLGLALLYRFGPSRAAARWRWITPGSLLAAGLWLAASLRLFLLCQQFWFLRCRLWHARRCGGGVALVLHLGLRGHPRRRVERRARAADQCPGPIRAYTERYLDLFATWYLGHMPAHGH